MAVKIECVAPTRSQLGEGALWDVEDAALWWVDIRAGLIHKFDPVAGVNTSFDFGEPVGCLARRAAGGLIVASQSGFHLFDPETGARTALVDPESHLAGNRFNDGGTDPRGRFWAGTMRDDGGPPEMRGRFYRYNDDGTATAFFDPFFTTNGLTFSPDGQVMYVADTNRTVQTIWKFDYDLDTGTPSNKRLFFDCRDLAGRPDGATVDADGCYWMAGVTGWQVVRITPQGVVDRIIEMPVEKPSKVMFGGANLDLLYVTSIGENVQKDLVQSEAGQSEAGQPDAGGLFAISGLGVTGLAQARYAG
ncbi:SMP-30/gluconolactonase/LRE family protein [Alphaproteobacteria bacterium]|jgi:L-arabinonolactonase|nr:SMP-30/gluconolactonase/LRE family protein [Alphaproteobacteria bacterium]